MDTVAPAALPPITDGIAKLTARAQIVSAGAYELMRRQQVLQLELSSIRTTIGAFHSGIQPNVQVADGDIRTNLAQSFQSLWREKTSIDAKLEQYSKDITRLMDIERGFFARRGFALRSPTQVVSCDGKHFATTTGARMWVKGNGDKYPPVVCGRTIIQVVEKYSKSETPLR